METNSSSPLPDFILLLSIAECGLSGSNGKGKIWTVFSDLPWTQAMFACPLNPLYSRSAKRHVERMKELGESALKR